MSRSCSWTCRGPILSSVMMTEGCSARMDSALSSCPFRVTCGRLSRPGIAVAVSLPTSWHPNPSAYTMDASPPLLFRARMRVVSVTVWRAPSSLVTVAGNVCELVGSSEIGMIWSLRVYAVVGPLSCSGSGRLA